MIKNKKKTKKKAAQPKNKKDWYAAYAAKRNEERREAYAADPSYRQKVLSGNRAQYRKAHGENGKDCRANLSRLGDIGSIRFLRGGPKPVKALTFTNAELAEALDYSLVAVYRMQADGRLPKAVVEPIYKEAGKSDKGSGGRFLTDCVYTKAEVVAIINVLGEHQESVMHYRAVHTETQKRIYAAVKLARKKG